MFEFPAKRSLTLLSSTSLLALSLVAAPFTLAVVADDVGPTLNVAYADEDEDDENDDDDGGSDDNGSGDDGSDDDGSDDDGSDDDEYSAHGEYGEPDYHRGHGRGDYVPFIVIFDNSDQVTIEVEPGETLYQIGPDLSRDEEAEAIANGWPTE